MRKCKVCGKEFLPTNERRTLCSDECQHRNMINLRKAYMVRNPDARYHASMAFWKDVVFSELGRVCIRCGSTEDLELDHKIPVILGGANRLFNLQVLCSNCHKEKGRAFPSRNLRWEVKLEDILKWNANKQCLLPEK